MNATAPEAEEAGEPPRAGGVTYYLTRFLLLRLLGFVYAAAFLAAARQIVPLIGEHGLTPARIFLELVRSHFGSRFQAELHVPSIFWIGLSDRLLQGCAWMGFGLSVMVLAGYANGLMLAALWVLYMSYVHIGQIWYGYGWEIQLLETGFLAIFLCPVLDGRPFSRQPPPILILWLYRWLGFRIMLGAGLIKLRGDGCWRDLTCLYYHYETQPIPNPLSRLFHFAPHWMLRLEAGWNHFIELIAPWFAFGPRLARHIAGALAVSFQGFLILSGNLSFLNYLTMVPFLACFDDQLLRRLLPGVLARHLPDGENPPARGYVIASGCVAALVGFLSISPVLNMLSGAQVMNTSFDPLDLVNTYGAFGSVGRERHEIIFEGTGDAAITPDTKWKEYEFPAKPGDPRRRPAIIAPYQPRLDWQIWFAAMSSPAEYPWTLNFVWKLLHNDAGTLSLLANNPFPGEPPRYIRARLYLYHFAPAGGEAWWTRTLEGEWLPALSAEDARLQQIVQEQPWMNE